MFSAELSVTPEGVNYNRLLESLISILSLMCRECASSTPGLCRPPQLVREKLFSDPNQHAQGRCSFLKKNGNGLPPFACKVLNCFICKFLKKKNFN